MVEEWEFDQLLELIHPTMPGMSCPKSTVTWYMYYGHGFSIARRNAFQRYYDEVERICACSECTKLLHRSAAPCWRRFLHDAPAWWFMLSMVDPETHAEVR